MRIGCAVEISTCIITIKVAVYTLALRRSVIKIDLVTVYTVVISICICVGICVGICVCVRIRIGISVSIRVCVCIGIGISVCIGIRIIIAVIEIIVSERRDERVIAELGIT